MKSIINIKDVGDVLFERSVRAKRLNITVRSSKSVRVAMPRGLSVNKAKKYVEEKREWIKTQISKLKILEEKHVAERGDYPADKTASCEKLVSRLHEISERLGLSFNRVFIRNQRTRWGSCSHKNNINLNIQLIYLADELIDYVIIHELVHTYIKNHSKEFWAEMERILPDCQILRSKLKKIPLLG